MARKVALVTGASAGLGEQLARLFAKDGHDVVLVARRADRLEALAGQLRQAHAIAAHVIAADLADPAAPQRLHGEVAGRGLPIEFLVNNAGFGTCGRFLDLDLDKEGQMIEVNCAALVKLSHLFGRAMRERRSGRILNVASTAAFQPGPYMATYYATKAFVVSFSEALAHELRGSGVTVTCHCPGATQTEFASRAGSEDSLLFRRARVPDAAEVARHAYAAMMRGRTLAVHGLINRIGMESVRLAPRCVPRAVAAALNRPAG
jgi:short-subunit dehydrogenase